MFSLNMLFYPIFSLLLSTWIFLCWASRGGHSKSLLLSDSFNQRPPSCLKVVGGVVAHEILETAQSPNSSFPFHFLFDLGLGLGLVNFAVFFSIIKPQHIIKGSTPILSHMCWARCGLWRKLSSWHNLALHWGWQQVWRWLLLLSKEIGSQCFY